MPLCAETGSLTFGCLCTWALKGTRTSCQLSFQYPTGEIHAEIARPFPSGREILPLWTPSLEVHSLKLQVFCTAHLTQQTRNERVLGKHFLLTFHILSFAMTSRIDYTAFVKAAETSCSGYFYSGCFLIWDGSNLQEQLQQVWMRKPGAALPLQPYYFWQC